MKQRCAPLYEQRTYPLVAACGRLSEIATIVNPRPFRVLLWTNPKGFSIEKGRWGQQEIEHGYHAREEDFINEMTAVGERWKWERATTTEELETYLSRFEFGAVVVLGSSPSYLVRKAVYYCDHIPAGPKTVLLEFERRFWDSAHPYLIWDYLYRVDHLHLLNQFVHLVSRKQQLKFLPVAYDERHDPELPIWDIPAHRLTPNDIEVLFESRTEESDRLDYKRAAILSDETRFDRLISRICGMANSKGGTIVIGIAENEGAPLLPILQGLEHVDKADKTLNRVQQVLSSRFGRDAPEVDSRSLSVRGKTVLVLQIGESVTKRCGMLQRGNVDVIPVRRGRTTDWMTLTAAV
jgi:hypothetical protein